MKVNFINNFQYEMLLNNPKEFYQHFDTFSIKPYRINDIDNQIDVNCSFCYGNDGLVIIVKIKQDTLINRDRAYQNGDGIQLVFSKVEEEFNPTAEFYVIGISPLEISWRQKFIWYLNVDLAMKALKDSLVRTIGIDNHTYIITTIPWHEITPYNGFFDEFIGFNISYVQATPKGRNIYILKEDKYIQSEQSLRQYVVFTFEQPTNGDFICKFILNRKHANFEQQVSMKCSIFSDKNTVGKIIIKRDDKIINEFGISITTGLNQLVYEINKSLLLIGNNQLDITLKVAETSYSYFMDLYIYQENDFYKLKEEINNLQIIKDKSSFIKESIYTVQFLFDNLINRLEHIKPYEDITSLICLKDELVIKLNDIKNSKHLFSNGKVSRLAHLSELDNTLQPYSIYLPSKVNQDTKLFIYLHGSGSDDTSLKGNSLHFRLAEENNLILLAPYARGTSHYYCNKEAREDIRELTEKIAKLFDIKNNNIYLSGFSMGGYGVFRVYDEYPHLYKKLIIFSGHPSFGQYFNDVDYDDNENILRFQNVPMIIFHGDKDNNCSYQEIKPFFNKLQLLNRNCQIIIKEHEGHNGLINEWYIPLVNFIND